MSCKFNPKLFKEFSDNKCKIIPQLTDDWKFEFEYYSKYPVWIYSKKLNQKFYIPILKFLDMVTKRKMTIENGNKIKGEWIAGNDRKLHTPEEFKEWKKQVEKTNGKVKAKDLILGKKYIFECGMEAYLIVIDRIKNGNKTKPVYVFANKEENSIAIIEKNNLKDIKKMIDEDVNENIAKIALSKYLTFASESELGKIRLKIPVYLEGKILVDTYFKDNIFEKIWYTFISEKDSKLLRSIKQKIWNIVYNKFGQKAMLKDVKIEDGTIKYNVVIKSWPENKEKIIASESYIDTLYVYQLDKNKISELFKNVKIYEKIL